MKRTWIRRSTKPIARHQRLKSGTTKLRARKVDPARRRFAKRRCKPFTDWIKQEACCITEARTGEWVLSPEGSGYLPLVWVRVDPAHVVPKARGSDDLYNVVPLARHLHEAQEGHTAEFEAKYGVDLTALAREYTHRWLATEEGKAWTAKHEAA